MKPAAGKASRSRSRGHLRLISGPACPHPGHVDPTGQPSPHAHLAVGYDAVEEAALAQLALDIEAATVRYAHATGADARSPARVMAVISTSLLEASVAYAQELGNVGGPHFDAVRMARAARVVAEDMIAEEAASEPGFRL